jgi:hypothetical protein
MKVIFIVSSGVPVCAETLADVKHYRFVSGSKRRDKAIERGVPSSYQIAQSLGFNGDFRAWERLLHIRE